MAIIIPSKNTYDRHNQKVRDNVIERIEVGAVEVLPNNKYEEPIFNGRVPIENKQSNAFVGVKSLEMGNYAIYRPTVCCGTKNYFYEYITFDLVVERQVGNSYATSIFSGKKENGNNYIGVSKSVSKQVFEYNIEDGVTFEGNYINEYDYTYSFDTEKMLSYNGNKKTIERKQYNDIDGEKISFSIDDQNQYPVAGSVIEKLTYNKSVALDKKENITTKSTVEGGMAIWAIPNFEAIESIENNEYISLRSPTIEKYEDRYVIKNISVPVSLKTIYYASAFYRPLGDGHTINDRFSNKYPVKVVEVVQIAQQVELTVYGNTIGIDLTDNTVYINGENKKNVYSVEGNELMQTENYTISSFDKDLQFLIDIVENDNGYRTFSLVARLNKPKPYEITVTTDARVYLSSGVYNDYPKTFVFAKGETEKRAFVITEEQFLNVYSVEPMNTKIKQSALEKMYSETQTQYANGKETATIRCSISDYYDYDSGDKIISIDNSTGKMSFDIGDIVTPMVFGVDGNDRPMSLYNNGKPKKFQVLGKKMFYDGAVWQELSLQEV